ncbi:Mss4-like protein [Mycena leptocephala]|nr:Mss4-like protein [Mycena leptocephala]
MPHKGACLCGQTTLSIPRTKLFLRQTVCHRTDCRQTSGSAFSINVLAPKKDVTIIGPVKEYNTTAVSGNRGTRVFCGNCGSAIALSAAFGGALVIQTGNFADFAHVPVTTELFVKDRWSGLQPISGAAQVQTMD